MEYNLYDRAEYEETLEPVCIENGLGVFSYFSLASGFLTGKYRVAADVANKARGDFVKKYLNERGFRNSRRTGSGGEATSCNACTGSRCRG
jgi:aryl-alcohol dehydrogenase-like predicted oxidoreductase